MITFLIIVGLTILGCLCFSAGYLLMDWMLKLGDRNGR